MFAARNEEPGTWLGFLRSSADIRCAYFRADSDFRLVGPQPTRQQEEEEADRAYFDKRPNHQAWSQN